MNNGYKQYKQVTATTASGVELVLMLYRGTIKFINAAVAAIGAREFERAHTDLMKAQNVLEELRTTLNTEAGGGIASDLQRLYAYCEERLREANIEKDADAAIEVRTLLQELAVSWEAVRVNTNGAAAPGEDRAG